MKDKPVVAFCIICGNEFRPLNLGVVLCPVHGGPPELEPESPPEQDDLKVIPPTPKPKTQPPKITPPEPEIIELAGDKTVLCLTCGTLYPPDKACPICHPEQIPPKEEEVHEEEVPAGAWKPGSIVMGTYKVIALLGEGGMGRVYRVQHMSWKLDLAAKRPRQELFQDAASREKFVSEAETWVNLGLHPNIVTCYYVRTLDDLPHIFSECITGGSLKRWVEDRSLYEGNEHQVIGRIIDIAIQVAWGLHHAHTQKPGLVHCDMKPANVLMTPKGIAKVSDFGLARARGAIGTGLETGQSRGIAKGKVWLTPQYASPEQFAGKDLDPKTDMWSWAISLLELFNGSITWMSGTIGAELLNAYQRGELGDPSIPRMPRDLSDLLHQCFQENPLARPKNMFEVAEILEEIYRDVTGKTYPRQHPPQSTQLQADSLNNKAISLIDLGRDCEAEAAWESALVSDRQHPDVIYNQAVYLWSKGKPNPTYPEASEPISLLEPLARQSPDEWRRWYLLGLAYMAMKNAEGAERSFKRAISAVQESNLEEAERQAALNEIQEELNTIQALLPTWPRIVRRFEGVNTMIFSLAVTPDGKHAVTGSGVTDNSLRMWRLEDGERMWALPGHAERIRTLDISPDGRYAISASVDHTLHVVNLSNTSERHQLIGHVDSVNAVAFLPDSKQAISGSSDQKLLRWDISTEVSTPFASLPSGIFALAVSLSGEKLVTVSNDRKICVWAVASAEKLLEWQSVQEEIWSVAISPDGTSILTAGKESDLFLWEMSSGKLMRQFGIGDQAIFLPDGKKALSHTRSSLFLYDLANGTMLLSMSLPGAGDGVEIKAMDVCPDGRTVLLAGRRVIYQIDLGLIEQPQPRYVVTRVPVGHSPGETETEFLLLLDAADARMKSDNWPNAIDPLKRARGMRNFERHPRVLELWAELGTHGIRQRLRGCMLPRIFEGAPGEDTCVAISPNGKWAVSGSEEEEFQDAEGQITTRSVVRLWDLQKGACETQLGQHKGRVTCVAVSGDGQVIASGGKDGLFTWQWDGDEWLPVAKGLGRNIQALSLSLDGRYAFVADKNEDNFLFDTAAGKELVMYGEGGEIIALSPDGRSGVMASGKKIILYDLVNKTVLENYRADDAIRGLTYSANRRLLLAFDRMDRLYKWEVKIGLQTLDLKGRIFDIALTADSRYLVIAGIEGLSLWDVNTLEKIATLEKPKQYSFSKIAFSMNGRYVIAAGEQLCTWELDWESRFPEPADWDDGARPYLENFLNLHLPFHPAGGATTIPTWNKEDVQSFLVELGYRGFGWLQPSGVRKKLKEEAAKYASQS